MIENETSRKNTPLKTSPDFKNLQFNRNKRLKSALLKSQSLIKDIRSKHHKKINNKNVPTNDIQSLHNKVLEFFDNEYLKLDQYRDKLSQLYTEQKQYYRDLPFHKYQYIMTTREIYKLKDKIQNIEKGYDYVQYIIQSKPLLQKYIDIINQPRVIDFTLSRQQDHIKMQLEIQDIVREYVDVVNTYTSYNIHPIDFCSNISIKHRCDICDGEFITLNGCDICSGCAFKQDKIKTESSFQDVSRIDFSSRYTFSRSKHFTEIMDKFQGKKPVHKNLIETIKQEMEKSGIEVADLTKKQIIRILNATGNNKRYDLTNAIHAEITGIYPPNISHLEPKLEEMYDMFDKAFQELKNTFGDDSMNNSINKLYLLYKFLLHLGYPCYTSDFYIFVTRKNLDKYDKIIQTIFGKMGWTFYN